MQEATDDRHRLLNLAADLLWAVWTEIDPEYKSKYRQNIWEQVETTIAACARMTTNLDKFLSAVCGKLSVAVPGKEEGDCLQVALILQGQYADPDAILQVIREYPQVVVLKVRVMNDERKREYASATADNQLV